MPGEMPVCRWHANMGADRLTPTLLIYLAAALFELLGSYAFWYVLRLGGSRFWLIAGTASLVIFAYLLTRIGLDASGRVYAAYGGIYILASLLWLWQVDGRSPDLFDVLGVGLSVAGALVIILGRHSAG